MDNHKSNISLDYLPNYSTRLLFVVNETMHNKHLFQHDLLMISSFHSFVTQVQDLHENQSRPKYFSSNI